MFVFPGQGAQWEGMGVELLDAVAGVRGRDREVRRGAGPRMWTGRWWTCCAGRRAAPSLERVDVVQPALFAVMVSLAALWRSYGVEPDAVVGHSQGEIAAAYVAGGLSLEDAARVVALRSRLMRGGWPAGGGMVSVALPASEVEELLARRTRAGCRSRRSTARRAVVVSGEPEALDELLADVRAGRRPGAADPGGLRVALAPQVEAMLEAELRAVLAPIAPRRGRCRSTRP